jgi:uroporphyrinogen decarboxylase
MGEATMMTSRERVIAALNHEEPDRVPIDFGSNLTTSVNVIAYNRLKKHLGITSPTYMRLVTAMLAATDLDEDLEVMKRMGGDILDLPRYMTPVGPAAEWKDWTLKDGSTCKVPTGFNPEKDENGDWVLKYKGKVRSKMPKDGYYFDPVYRQLGHIENLKQLEEQVVQWRDSSRVAHILRMSEEELDILKKRARRIYEETDYAIFGDTYLVSLYQISQEFFGYEKFWIFMATDPDLIHFWMDFLTESYVGFITTYLKAVGEYINVILIGDDYGTQQSTQISVQMFRELCKPYMTRLCEAVRETSPNVKLLFHSDGAIVPLIPEFIDCGIDILNPVQSGAEGMDPAKLKRQFGKELSFWGGGVNAQTTLYSGTVHDIEREVKERLDVLKPGGGYVFATEHDIQEHVSPEKIVAIFDTAQKYRDY